MHPAQPGQTQTAPAGLPELFMDVAFFAPKAAKLRVKAQPGRFAATEDAQALHGDLERFPLGILPAWVTGPRAPHLLAPARLEMGREQFPIVVEHRALQQ